MLGATWVGSVNGGVRTGEEVRMKATKNVRYPINADPERFGYWGLDPNAPAGADKSLKQNDFYYGSLHPGGAHFTMADGSVQFMHEDMELTVLQHLATRGGGETEAGF